MLGLKKFKQECIACGDRNPTITKEHVWPKWLIELTDINQTGLKWVGGKKLSASSITIPLCAKCNSTLGANLEAPVQEIFLSIEAGDGLSDHEAELLIRWLWKFEGFNWRLTHPEDTYSDRYSIIQRVLGPIDAYRGSLILAISRIRTIDPTHGDLPVGIDSNCEVSAIHVAAVIHKLAIMVVDQQFETSIPHNFTIHRMAPKDDIGSKVKLISPKIGFEDDNQAVLVTTLASQKLSRLHDEYAKFLLENEDRLTGGKHNNS